MTERVGRELSQGSIESESEKSQKEGQEEGVDPCETIRIC